MGEEVFTGKAWEGYKPIRDARVMQRLAAPWPRPKGGAFLYLRCRAPHFTLPKLGPYLHVCKLTINRSLPRAVCREADNGVVRARPSARATFRTCDVVVTRRANCNFDTAHCLAWKI